MDRQSRVVLLAWLIDMITEPAQESVSVLKDLHRFKEVEELVVSELIVPKDRDVIAKERSSHWSMMLFSSQVFYDASMKDLFRLDFSMMACLVKELSPHFIVDRDAPDAVPPPKRVAIFVYYCAQASSLVATADRFAVGPSTVSGIIKEVAAIVCQNLRELIAFPSFRQCASHFASCCGVPQIVGCIDGSHIPISKPAVDGTMYYNRKCWYSVVLQAVVDWRGRFCDVDCKWPGRVGDSRVFRNSMLGSAFPAVSATSDTIALPTSDETHAEIPYFLLGDSGYQNTNYLVTTFELAETADPIIKKLNSKLTHARYRVECAFGQLKCRWRVLLKGIQLNVDAVPNIVYALCILQNFLMDRNDRFKYSEVEWKRIILEYESTYPQPGCVDEGTPCENTRDSLKLWTKYKLQKQAQD